MNFPKSNTFDNAVVASKIMGPNQVQILHLSTGNTTTVLEEAIGIDEGFEILDVRKSSENRLLSLTKSKGFSVVYLRFRDFVSLKKE